MYLLWLLWWKCYFFSVAKIKKRNTSCESFRYLYLFLPAEQQRVKCRFSYEWRSTFLWWVLYISLTVEYNSGAYHTPVGAVRTWKNTQIYKHFLCHRQTSQPIFYEKKIFETNSSKLGGILCIQGRCGSNKSLPNFCYSVDSLPIM
jgi:hypothetical protein